MGHVLSRMILLVEAGNAWNTGCAATQSVATTHAMI